MSDSAWIQLEPEGSQCVLYLTGRWRLTDLRGIVRALPRLDAGATARLVLDGSRVQELDTAVRENIDLTYVVMNDEAIGAEYHRLQHEKLDYEMAQIDTPSLDAVARAFGARAYHLDAEDQIRSVAEGAIAGSGFRLIDARISRNVVSRHFRIARVHLDRPAPGAAPPPAPKAAHAREDRAGRSLMGWLSSAGRKLVGHKD